MLLVYDYFVIILQFVGPTKTSKTFNNLPHSGFTC